MLTEAATLEKTFYSLYFIHKIKVVLKELRETDICLKIIFRAKLFQSEELIINALQESNELIAIFVKSVETAQKNSHLQ